MKIGIQHNNRRGLFAQMFPHCSGYGCVPRQEAARNPAEGHAFSQRPQTRVASQPCRKVTRRLCGSKVHGHAQRADLLNRRTARGIMSGSNRRRSRHLRALNSQEVDPPSAVPASMNAMVHGRVAPGKIVSIEPSGGACVSRGMRKLTIRLPAQ